VETGATVRASHYARTAIVTSRRGEVNVSVWLKPDDFAKLEAIVRALDTNRSAFVRMLIHNYLDSRTEYNSPTAAASAENVPGR
jgi:hypothetical protein